MGPQNVIVKIATLLVEKFMKEGKEFHSTDILCEFPPETINVVDTKEVLDGIEAAIVDLAQKYGYSQEDNMMWVKGEVVKGSVEALEQDLNALHPILNRRNYMAAFLGSDSDVTVKADVANKTIDVIVAGCETKAMAFRELLEGETVIGKDTVKILVNGVGKNHHSKFDGVLLKKCFAGNRLVYNIKKADMGGGNIFWIIMTRPMVVQFPNDCARSPYGYDSFSAEHLGMKAFSKLTSKTLLFSTIV